MTSVLNEIGKQIRVSFAKEWFGDDFTQSLMLLIKMKNSMGPRTQQLFIEAHHVLGLGRKVYINGNFLKTVYIYYILYSIYYVICILYIYVLSINFRHKLLEPELANNRAWRFDGAILYTSQKLPEEPGYFVAVKNDTCKYWNPKIDSEI